MGERMPSAVGERGDAIAGWIGWLIHRLAHGIRRAVMARSDAELANVAVMCVGFLRYGSAQAIGLRQAGLDVTLYYVDRRSEFAASREDRMLLLDEARAAGVTIVRVPPRRIRNLPRDIVWLHRDLRRRRIAMAVVQSHMDPRYATLGLGLPVAIVLHDPQPHSGDTLAAFPAPVRAVSRLAELTAACLLVHSQRLFEQIRPLLRRLPVGVVPHGANMAPSPAPIPAERRLLVFGRLFPYKGVDTALDAFRAVAEQMPDVKLIVAGRGPLASLAIGQPSVEVQDEYIAESDVGALLEGVRLVLLPYRDATQSGVGVQAIARGVPCIVSSVGGLPELVQGASTGLIVPPSDPESLARAIARYIDHDEALRRAVFDHAQAHFSWPVAARRLRSELERLAAVQ
jgi:glycosyltransferase involved in cell wall biosynthesis